MFIETPDGKRVNPQHLVTLFKEKTTVSDQDGTEYWDVVAATLGGRVILRKNVSEGEADALVDYIDRQSRTLWHTTPSGIDLRVKDITVVNCYRQNSNPDGWAVILFTGDVTEESAILAFRGPEEEAKNYRMKVLQLIFEEGGTFNKEWEA